jgi:hypothetical protein
MIDVAAVRSLADLYRREQSAGHCLDPDQAATTAVTHLLALGYRRPANRPDLIAAPAPGIAVPDPEPPTGPARSVSSMERAEVDVRSRPATPASGTASPSPPPPQRRDRQVPTPQR